MCAFVLRPGQAGGYFQSCSALLDTMPPKGTAPKRRCSLQWSGRVLQNLPPQLSTCEDHSGPGTLTQGCQLLFRLSVGISASVPAPLDPSSKVLETGSLTLKFYFISSSNLGHARVRVVSCLP